MAAFNRRNLDPEVIRLARSPEVRIAQSLVRRARAEADIEVFNAEAAIRCRDITTRDQGSSSLESRNQNVDQEASSTDMRELERAIQQAAIEANPREEASDSERDADPAS